MHLGPQYCFVGSGRREKVAGCLSFTVHQFRR